MVKYRKIIRRSDMKIFAVSDLHLPGNQDKPMDIFGGDWSGHLNKIKDDWREKVSNEDAVLIAGDISWAMTLENALPDLCSLADLPGKKIFIKGNHDYWWSGITALRRSVPDPSFYFLQNDCIRLDGVIVCGSRGWTCPGSADYTDADQKIYVREAERFRLAFRCVESLRQEGDKLICMIHYPPFNSKKEPTLFTELFEGNGADKVVFGHLHRNAGAYPMRFTRNRIEYILTSCDLLGFRLVQIY